MKLYTFIQFLISLPERTKKLFLQQVDAAILNLPIDVPQVDPADVLSLSVIGVLDKDCHL